MILRKNFSYFLFVIFSIASMSGCPSEKNKVTCGPPIASAGNDLEGVTGQRIVLHGSFRLPPEDEFLCQSKLDGVSFHWEQVSGSDVQIEGQQQVEASFVPTEPGEYSFRCKAIFPEASDQSKKESQWDTVKVSVTERTCPPPVADAGQDQLLGMEQDAIRIEMDGSGSQPSQSCPDLKIVSYTWSLEQKPEGSAATISPEENPSKAWLEADTPGDYMVRLLVQDSLDKEGRESTDDATVLIKVLRRTPCEQTLDVQVTSALDDSNLNGVTVVVVDSQGVSHETTSDPSGLAHFDSLAAGPRQSITVSSAEKVPALPGTGDQSERNKYQIVTVLDQCSSFIHIPMPLTDSGKAAISKGVVTARIPQKLFDILPHSKKYAGVCSSDDECKTGYVCKPTDIGDRQCTPVSLLPVFGIDEPNVSGQFRGILLTALQPKGSLPDFPVNALFAPPVSDEAFLPGNLATDDSFLNSLGPLLGNDVWGESCTTVADCPNTSQYSCENDDSGNKRCKDTRPLTTIKLEVPSGQGVGMVMLMAVVDVGMENLISLLSSLLSDSQELEFDVGSLLASFQFRTLYVCPLKIDVATGTTTDITNAIGGIDPDSDCWAIPHQQIETIVPVPDSFSIKEDNSCSLDSDCGWPGSGLRCLAPDDTESSRRYCLIPLYRVSLISDNQVQLKQSLNSMDPSSSTADKRVCAWLPSTSSHPQQCLGDDGRPQQCDPPQQCQVDTPANTSCAIPYGLALVTADVPSGHRFFSEGGRMILGFQFNISPLSSDTSPSFLIPSMEVMGATQLGAVQKYFRNIFWLPDKTYQVLAGSTSASRVSKDDVSSIVLPDFPFFSTLTAEQIDAGLEVEVWFEPKDPTAPCQSMEYKRTWATANSMLEPGAQHNLLSPDLVIEGLPAENLAVIQIAKVDRVDPDQDGKIDSLLDNQWLVFVPPASTTVTLPMDNSPFSSGDEIRLRIKNASTGAPYDHDLFPAGLILRGQTAMTSDAYELIAP